MVCPSSGAAFTRSTPRRATLVSEIDEILNVDLSKLSQEEWVHGLSPFWLTCRGSSPLKSDGANGLQWIPGRTQLRLT
jgi:hypothetical protein